MSAWTFGAPWQLLWLGLALPIVLLHLFRRPRGTVEVSSIWLWQASKRKLNESHAIQRLRPYLALILQLLALLLAALFLAEPRLGGRGEGRLILIVDTSTSMLARDGNGVTALDAARLRALELAQAFDGHVGVVEAGAGARVLAPPGTGTARRALRNLRPSGNGADAHRAFQLAAERTESGDRIVFLSDRALRPATYAGAAELRVEDVSRGESNAAIVAASLVGEGSERRAVGRVWGDAARVHGQVGERTLGDAEVSEGRFVLPVDEAFGVLELRLEGDDALPLDDVAWLALGEGRGVHARVVGDVGRNVRRALRVLGVSTGGEAPPDLEIVRCRDAAGAELSMRAEALVLMAAGEDCFGVHAESENAWTRITRWERNDERMRFVSLDGVPLGTSAALAGEEPLIIAEHGPVAVSRRSAAARTTWTSLWPDGAWGRDPSFVMVVQNLVASARRRRRAGGFPAGPPGRPLAVADGVDVRAPSGAAVESPAIRVPFEVGVFRVEPGERFALRHVLSEEESDLRPRFEVLRGGAQGENAREDDVQAPSQAAPWFAAFFLLTVAADALWAGRKRA
ncbi:MAG: BatA and WFA domain-containing protein [Myxococcota bacterium]